MLENIASEASSLIQYYGYFNLGVYIANGVLSLHDPSLEMQHLSPKDKLILANDKFLYTFCDPRYQMIMAALSMYITLKY